MSKPLDQSNAVEEAQDASSSESERAALARLLFEHTENQIKAADSKAWLTIAANGILITVAEKLLNGLLKEVVKKSLDFTDIGVPIAFIACMLVAIVLSLWYAVQAVKPTFETSDNENLFFFKNIAGFAELTFVRRFNDQTRDSAYNSLLGEVHAKARIAERKFSFMQRSLSALFLALSLGAISLALAAHWRFFIVEQLSA